MPRSARTLMSLGGRRKVLGLLPKNSIGAEIGVHKGDFSARILKWVKPKILHLIDPWKFEASEIYKDALYGGRAKGGQKAMDARYRRVLERFREYALMGRILIHRGRSADVLASLHDESLDWIYIDGNHLYDHVKQDLALSFLKVKSGGLIAVDDYVSGGWWQGGVMTAVNEFVIERPVRIVAICSNQFVLSK